MSDEESEDEDKSEKAELYKASVAQTPESDPRKEDTEEQQDEE